MTELLHRAQPERAARSQLTDFARFVTSGTGREFLDYDSLHRFSTTEVALFWSMFLEWSGILKTGELHPACVGAGVEGTRFFPAIRLSWAENVLVPRAPAEEAAVAIVACDETGARAEVSRAALRRRVRAVAAALEARGIREGDRVAAVARNTIEAIVACLAVTSLGATWSSLAPDMGLEASVARLTPLAPKLLFLNAETSSNGTPVKVPLVDLVRALPSVETVVSLDARDNRDDLPLSLDALEREGRSLPAANPDGPWRRFPFEQPLFVLFSSGTTGAPKCIVHGHGGTLIEHLKEHRLHCELGPDDRLSFQTSAGWMMWNWTVSAIATGAALVLYDGSVSYPERDSLLRIAGRERVTVFGTSPAYLQYLLDAGVTAAGALLGDVREMLSTGSVLRAPLHRWAKQNLPDVPLQSISGGTDIIGCFVMGNPWTDVYEGESSCIGLGFDVRAWSAGGAASEGRGELVCVAPFPSRPVGFLADPEGTRIHAAYYAQHEGAWTHGDLVEVTSRRTVRVLGRCDGVLNIRGIRIGPSEIYEVLASHVPEIAQAMAVDEDAPREPGGKKLVLFVVLGPGSKLDRSLTLRMKKHLKERATTAHVPATVIAVGELPTTFSGKLSEAAMQDALNGRAVRNLAALRNPTAIAKALEALRGVDS
jgi:acetoacetyl-CoA synthetase